MNLSALSANRSHRLTIAHVTTLLWISVGVFVAGVITLLLMSRLGLPLYFTYLATIILFTCTVIVLSWVGRTMTSAHFFFAEQQSLSSVTGISGITDWISGAWLMLFVGATTVQKMLWVPALMLGLAMMSVLFSTAFYRSGSATLSGFFAWRYPRSFVGPISVPIISVVLFLLALAEFEVAYGILETMNFASSDAVKWTVLALAVFPVLMGGWLSLVFVNLALAVWMLFCVIAPTFMLGFLPNLLASDASVLVEDSILPPLGPLPSLPLQADSFPDAVIWVFGLSFGFAVLPHVFSRLALGRRASAAMEHLGWSALFAFVVIATSALSIGVVALETSDPIAGLLANLPMLHVLPYIAVLIAALNALSATLMALSSGIVRGVQRSRRKDPGERSMFGTRIMVLVFAILIGTVFFGLDTPLESFFILAISLAGATLFIPLVGAAWVSGLPRWLPVSLIIFGTIVVGLEIWQETFDGPETFFSSPMHAAFTTIFLSAISLVAVKVLQEFLGRKVDDPQLVILRGE